MRSFIITLVCLALSLWAQAADGTPTPTSTATNDPQKLLGCWKNIESGDLVRFEAAKFTQYSKGGLGFCSAKYEPGKVIVSMQGQKVEIAYTLKDKQVTLNAQGTIQVFEKLDNVPDEVILKPFSFGKADKLAPEKVKEIQAECKKRVVEDQAVRTNPARQSEMGTVDSDNTAWLRKVCGEIGWLDCGRFGEETSHAAFLFVQHSGDLPLMVAVLPEIEKDLKAGKMRDGQSYALLYDRMKLHLGEKQRFGTQVSSNQEGDIVVLPIEDKNKVEQYRKELGIFPHSQYLEFFKQRGGSGKIVWLEE
jgi:hypothetical protein